LCLEDLPLESNQAIADHNIKDIYVNILEKPISFLLIMCDEIQEWGRFLLDYNNNYIIPIEQMEYTLTEKSIKVELDFYDKCDEIKSNIQNFDIDRIIDDKYNNLQRLVIPPEIDLNIQFIIIDFNRIAHAILYNRENLRWDLVSYPLHK
jgi:hypothetical protein